MNPGCSRCRRRRPRRARQPLLHRRRGRAGDPHPVRPPGRSAGDEPRPPRQGAVHPEGPPLREAAFLEWDGEARQLPTRDKRFILVDTYARWRITDPLKFFQRLRTRRGPRPPRRHPRRRDRNAIANHDLVEVVRTSNRVPEVDESQTEEERTLLEPIAAGREAIRREISRGRRSAPPISAWRSSTCASSGSTMSPRWAGEGLRPDDLGAERIAARFRPGKGGAAHPGRRSATCSGSARRRTAPPRRSAAAPTRRPPRSTPVPTTAPASRRASTPSSRAWRRSRRRSIRRRSSSSPPAASSTAI